MRNVFDQYSQAENRVTHAFLTALNEDRKLLGSFLSEIARVVPPTPMKDLRVLGQQTPGEEELADDDPQRKGIPDGWIHDENGWCVLVESKVTAELDPDQLRRHRGTAGRCGYPNAIVVAITREKKAPLPDVILLQWRDIYKWLRRQPAESYWADRAATYLEIAESKLKLSSGTLTDFFGFPFGGERPFTWRGGKRVLGLALEKLKTDKRLIKELGMNPDGRVRSSISGKANNADFVWDVLSLRPDSEAPYETNPHLTLGVHEDVVSAMLTIPANVSPDVRQKLIAGGRDAFGKVIGEVTERLQSLVVGPRGPSPRLRAMQRRFHARKFSVTDAEIDFDLRTIKGDAPVKKQPVWLDALYESLESRKGNYQLQIGMRFPVGHSPGLDMPEATDMIARAWLGCAPLVQRIG